MRYIFLLLLFTISSCTKDKNYSDQIDLTLRNQISDISPTSYLDYYILPEYGNLESIPQDSKNILTKEKVELGKFLFFETGFAGTPKFPEGFGTYSCSTCHIPEAGFKPNGPQGIADGGLGYGVNGDLRRRNTLYKEEDLDVQSARPLSLLNVAYVKNTFWNGQFGGFNANKGTEAVWDLRPDTERNHLGFEGIETVNFEGLFTHRIHIDSQNVRDLGYKQIFDEAFNDIPVKERYNNYNASLAISAYIRTILSDQAPFQYWLKGDQKAMTNSMKMGASLFFGKANCYKCHYEPNLGSGEFHALGVNDMYSRPSFNTSSEDRRNLGRGGFTQLEKDNYKFKVPGLYNIGDSPFYFHGASKITLEEVIDYKIDATSENPRISQGLLSSKFKSLFINNEEKLLLLDFLKNGLRDPNLIRYKPDHILSGKCFPNADYQSIIDIGCK